MPPVLRTERLTLSGHVPGDLDALAAMWADPRAYGMIGGVARSREEVWIRLLRSAGQWALFGYGSWVARDAETGALVGEAGLLEGRRAIDPPLACPEAGWTLAPAFHGRSLAREAMTAVLRWADAHPVARTCCIVDPANMPSLTLAGRLGFVRTGKARYHDRTVIVLHREALVPH